MRIPLTLVLGLLHAYIGLRLLAPLPALTWMPGVAALAALFHYLPKGWNGPVEGPHWRVMVPWIAMGAFSWLLVLTVARDLALLALGAWAVESAVAVWIATPLITAAGYFMARRTAPVTRVTIRVAGLPAALANFTIAQISDIHVGPTIKRPFVEKIVARVNGLAADMVAITGDLVDGSVPQLSAHTAPLAGLA